MKRRLLLPNRRIFIPKKPAVLRGIWDEEALEYSEGGGGLISASNPYVGPGDAAGVPVAFWGFRSASSAILGANTNIIRISNNTINSDFSGQSGNNGFVSPSAISSFFGGSSGLKPITLYEQTGLLTANQLTAAFASAPTWNNSGISSTIASMDFVAASLVFMQAASCNLTQTTPFTVAAVAKHLTSAAIQVLFTTSNSSAVVKTQSRYRAGAANIFDIYNNGVTMQTTCSDNAYHSVIWVFDGASSEIWIDGVLLSGTTSNTGIVPTDIFVLGANSTTPDFVLDGSICELGIWNGHLGSTTINALYNNQKNGYVGAGIP